MKKVLLLMIMTVLVGMVGSSTVKAQESKYTLSGKVTDQTGVAIEGVTIKSNLVMSNGHSPLIYTDSSGNYSIWGYEANSKYTITPSKQGYTCNPPVRYPLVTTEDQAGQDFVCTVVSNASVNSINSNPTSPPTGLKNISSSAPGLTPGVTVTTNPSTCKVNGKHVSCQEAGEKVGSFLKWGLGIALTLLVFALLITIFWLAMLIHAIKHPIEDKAAWIISIIVFTLPACLVYYFAVKRPFDRAHYTNKPNQNFATPETPLTSSFIDQNQSINSNPEQPQDEQQSPQQDPPVPPAVS